MKKSRGIEVEQAGRGVQAPACSFAGRYAKIQPKAHGFRSLLPGAEIKKEAPL